MVAVPRPLIVSALTYPLAHLRWTLRPVRWWHIRKGWIHTLTAYADNVKAHLCWLIFTYIHLYYLCCRALSYPCLPRFDDGAILER
jgi:hypothetical protein